jgi:hypothetical protein
MKTTQLMYREIIAVRKKRHKCAAWADCIIFCIKGGGALKGEWTSLGMEDSSQY